MRVGLVVGKFAPLHKGHAYLLQTARQFCDRLIVLAYSNPDLGFDSVSKYESILRVVPDALVHTFGEHDCPPNDASEYDHRIFCARWLDLFGEEPDIVFSSERYGEPFAAFLSGFFSKNVEHYMVDLHRVKYPISATQIRNGGYDEWKV